MHDSTQTIDQIVRRIPQPYSVETGPAAPPPGSALTAPLAPSRNKLLELPNFESRSKQFGFALLAILICALLFCYTSAFWAPAHDGNNQNGYLVGGKLLATKGTTGFEPKSPLSFVGWMWVMADAKSTASGGGMHYPKYPLGVPALVAIVYKIGGPEHGIEWAYRISPIAMTLAVLGMFFLARPLMGSFAAIMAMILLAGGQVGLVLTNNPNSHASAMFFLMSGMVLLIHWWKSDRWWIGALAGFLLGYAATIRYTEGLLLLPLLIAVFLKVRWRWPRLYFRAAVPLITWMLPLLPLAIFNAATVHSLTGYDSTNESTGFAWDKFSEKWNYAVGQLYWTGLYFVLPLAVAGLVMAFRWNWRVALLLCAWAVPGALLYMAYYYGMNMPLIGYLRFFTTVLPPAFLAAAWMLREASLPGANGTANARNYKSVAGPIAMGVFVSIVTIANMKSLVPSMERDQVVAANLADTGTRIRAAAPAGSVVFGHSQRLLNFLQFAGDYDLYGSDYIEGGSALPPIYNGGAGDPTPFQKARRTFLDKAFKELDRPAMIRSVTKICSDALGDNRRVFVILGANAPSWCKIFVDSSRFETRSVAEWNEPVRMSAEAARTLAAVGTMARSGSGKWIIIEVTPKPPAATTTADASASTAR